MDDTWHPKNVVFGIMDEQNKCGRPFSRDRMDDIKDLCQEDIYIHNRMAQDWVQCMEADCRASIGFQRAKTHELGDISYMLYLFYTSSLKHVDKILRWCQIMCGLWGYYSTMKGAKNSQIHICDFLSMTHLIKV